MRTARSTAALAGVLYLVTHVTSVGAVIFYGGSAFDPHASLAGRTAVLTGGLLEVILALAVVGTSVALYPLVRRYSQGLAAAYVALRTLEASVILTGVAVLLPVVARPATTAVPALVGEVSGGLHLIHDWTFLIGPGLVVPVHTMLLAWLLRRHRLVPAVIPTLGLIGGPLVAAMNGAVLFGLTTVQPLLVVPIFAWEILLAVWLIARGLREDGRDER